jgi:hypothetical protein
MRQRSTLLLNLILILSLAFSGSLSGILIPSPVAIGTSSAPVVAPGETSPDLASRRVKRERRHDRARKDRKQDRKEKDRKQKDKKQDRNKGRTKGGKQTGPQNDQAIELVRVGDWEDQCTGPNTVRLKRSELCTHGPDPAPPGFNIGKRVQLLSPQAARREMAAITCESDGGSGFRVQVLYVRSSSSPPMSAGLLASIRGWAGEMDEIFQNSAAETSGARSLRVVQDPNTCQPIVPDVQVTNAGLLDFDAMIHQLEIQGYNRSDRIYLSFVETTSAGICGIGTLWDDDRASGTDNWNNVGPSYSRVDAGCWSADVAAHEVMHNLGGVQLSAANTSGGFHCIDEWDIMCYSDAGPGVPQMNVVCTPEDPLDETLLDCNHDDYYHTNPAGGSYLANFWNPANNRFLIGAPVTPLPADVEVPSVEWVEPVSNDEEFEVSAGTVNLEADASDDVGVDRVEFWRWDNEDDDWVFLGDDLIAPYKSSVSVGALSMGENIISADAYDEAGRWIDEWIYLNRVNTPPPDTQAPTVTWTQPVGNGQQHEVATGPIALAATATDNVGVTRVEFKRYDSVGQNWLPISTDQTAPYTASVNAETLDLGITDLAADAYDAAGNSKSEVIHISRSEGPTPPPTVNPAPPDGGGTITPPKNKKKGKHKKKKKRR